MRLPPFYRFSSRTRIISGEHALHRLPYLLDSLHVSNPIILSDKGLEKAGLVGTLIETLGSDEHDQPPVFTDIPADSDLKTVNTIAAAYREAGCDGIIALWGRIGNRHGEGREHPGLPHQEGRGAGPPVVRRG